MPYGLDPTFTVAVTELVLSDMTETEPESLLATKTSPLLAAKSTGPGVVPTAMVATTALVLSEMTETVPLIEFATKSSPLPES